MVLPFWIAYRLLLKMHQLGIIALFLAHIYMPVCRRVRYWALNYGIYSLHIRNNVFLYSRTNSFCQYIKVMYGLLMTISAFFSHQLNAFPELGCGNLLVLFLNIDAFLDFFILTAKNSSHYDELRS